MIRMIFLFTLIASQLQAQSAYEQIGENEAVVFKTEFGIWTAKHVGTAFGATHVSSRLDIQFKRTKTRNKVHFKIGDGPPVSFVTRRGKKFSISASELNDDVWSIDNFRFFAGESGSPVFNAKGEVCGIVLGNYYKGRWQGRAAKIQKFAKALEEKSTVYGEIN